MLPRCPIDVPLLIRGGTCAGHVRDICGTCAGHPTLCRNIFHVLRALNGHLATNILLLYRFSSRLSPGESVLLSLNNIVDKDYCLLITA